ncbi:hypothetical protein CWN94_03805 [Vibrio splendidus]|uniref:ABC-three component system middle component 1 n=1 Tax=Vibrio TaxID=662 RepID=UPI000C855F72|nr:MULTISPECIES: ABC-three component system middle component 1 [Vibrio]PMN35852.1 hypothetical protein BCT33_09440 [Vibrio lentus]PMN58299.1 hypothetical protein BCT29_05865 [Vibrio lentus]PTO56710.1 hypothetical protein CWN94_03805 [Vibrio splendidus]
MIKSLVNDIASNQKYGFDFISDEDGFSFYRKSDLDNKRFLILHSTSSLHDADTYNAIIRDILPDELKSDSAFEKNTDFIILFEMDSLSNFSSYENKIFSIEENPYDFKKYVLYYSKEEKSIIDGMTYNEIREEILNRDSFKAYKSNVNFPSKYSFSARLFIKLPFLEVPVEEEELKSIDAMLTERYVEKDLVEFDKYINKIFESNPTDFNSLIEEYLDNEMEVK